MRWHFSNIIAVRCLFKMSQIRHINFTRTWRKIGNDKSLFYCLQTVHVWTRQKEPGSPQKYIFHLLLFLGVTLYLCTVHLYSLQQKLRMLTGHHSLTFLIFASLLSVKYPSVKFFVLPRKIF